MPDPARQREKELFEQLIELSNSDERRAFLDETCCGDPDLRHQLEELLEAHDHANEWLKPPPTPSIEEIESYDGVGLEDAPKTIGRYKLLSRIGAGGCGVIYLAEQQEPVHRQVALKIIRGGMDTKSVIERFELERQALAIMDHPNIARVLDAGATESGRPYFVMELVQGIKITDYCTQNRLSTEERLQLFRSVCHAIQHAHQKGIIHRDIKPSNILVATHDGRPVPKVIDFGIAKAVEEHQRGHTGLTIQVHLIGTPAYMSPEQTLLGNTDLDTRSDIYSLGVLLHELLIGRTPFDEKELSELGLDEMRRVIREKDPPRPSAVLATMPANQLRELALQQRTDPARLLSAVKGDLDWILTTALEKDRTRRYETAYGLALDISRHLSHEPVSARPPSRTYRLSKLVRRNRGTFMAGALVFVVLFAGLWTSTWLFLREREARREQARLREEAEHARANEMSLRHQTEAAEKITRASVLLRYGDIKGADELVATIETSALRPSLECVDLLRTLGQWHALAGRWTESAQRHFALSLLVTQVDDSDSDNVSRDLMPCSTAILESGDMDLYNRFRNAAITRFAKTTNPIPAEQVLKVSLLAPANPEILRTLKPLSFLVEETLKNRGPAMSNDPYMDAWRSFALALYSLRTNDAESVLHWTDQCLAYKNNNTPRQASAELLKAMALLSMGKKDDARALIEINRQIIDQQLSSPLAAGGSTNGFWFDWINAKILFQEASQSLHK